jgi:hypothetical protein
VNLLHKILFPPTILSDTTECGRVTLHTTRAKRVLYTPTVTVTKAVCGKACVTALDCKLFSRANICFLWKILFILLDVVSATHIILRYVWASGDAYTGDWRSGRRHGTGSFRTSNGSMYMGQWRRDLRWGR